MATAHTLGHIQEFDAGVESIAAYLERVQMFFLVNKLEEDIKVPTLLTLIGAKNYLLLRSLVSPASPNEKTIW